MHQREMNARLHSRSKPRRPNLPAAGMDRRMPSGSFGGDIDELGSSGQAVPHVRTLEQA